MRSRLISPAALRDLVRREALKWLDARPTGFTVMELVAAIGPQFQSGNELRRVRHQLEVMRQGGTLLRVDRGVFVRGDKAGAYEGKGDLTSQIWEAFRDAGGILKLDELLARLPPRLASKGRVRDYLAGCRDYMTFLPLKGYRQHWFVRNGLRETIPLPGRLQLLELKILKLRCGSVPEAWGIKPLKAFRRRVATALKDARDLRGVRVDALAANPDLVTTIGACLAESGDVCIVADGRSWSVDDWWADVSAHVGLEQAIAGFWAQLEDGQSVMSVQAAMSVSCWDAIGTALAFDPGALSRGWLLGKLSGLPN